ncbi:MAG: hypothetical protein Q4E16_00765 [Neisseria sp.]|nr:hypothetical protein [Neisseria sp.]
MAKTHIVERALVNRKTFYKYYSGKSDLAGAMIAEFKNSYAELLKERFKTNNLQNFLQKFIPFLFEQRKTLLALWRVQTKRHHLYADMQQLVAHAFIAQAIAKKGEKDWHYQAKMMSILSLESMKYWLELDQMPPNREMLKMWLEMVEIVRIE